MIELLEIVVGGAILIALFGILVGMFGESINMYKDIEAGYYDPDDDDEY